MKKFIRYVVPGLVVMVEFMGSLGVILFFTDIGLLKLYLFRMVTYGNGIGTPLSIFLLSGGLGAFLATAYHYLIYSYCLDRFNVDYSKLLKYCEDEKLIKLSTWDGKQVASERLNRIGQWRVLTAFWHSNLKNSEFFAKAERRAETLHDIAHGQGTQLVGAFIVALMLVAFDWYYPNVSFGLWYIIPLSILFLHFIAFRKVILSIQTVLSNFYIKEFEQQQEAYILFVNDGDYKNSSNNLIERIFSAAKFASKTA